MQNRTAINVHTTFNLCVQYFIRELYLSSLFRNHWSNRIYATYEAHICGISTGILCFRYVMTAVMTGRLVARSVPSVRNRHYTIAQRKNHSWNRSNTFSVPYKGRQKRKWSVAGCKKSARIRSVWEKSVSRSAGCKSVASFRNCRRLA